jgi:hypothetical protein
VIRGTLGIERLLVRWVSLILPFESTTYDADELLPWLGQCGFSLEEAFVDACRAISTAPHFLSNADTVVEGAVTGPSRRYDDVFGLLEEWEKYLDEVRGSGDLAAGAWEGRLDMAKQLHIQDTLEELGGALDVGVKGYVHARRRREGYSWIANHRRPDLLVPAWAEVIRWDTQTDSAELDAYFALASDPHHRVLGLLVLGERAIPGGIERLREALRGGGYAERKEAVRSFQRAYETTDLATTISAVLDDADTVARIEILSAVGAADFSGKKANLLDSLQVTLDPGVAPYIDVMKLVRTGAQASEVRAHADSLPAAELRAVLERVDVAAGGPLLIAAGARGLDIEDVVDRWLTADYDDAMAALYALAQIGTRAARLRISHALNHPHYKVQRLALQLLSPAANQEERSSILTLAGVPNGPVREALAGVIGKYQWSDGFPVLLNYLRDQRDSAPHNDHRVGPEPEYAVARAAAAALAEFEDPPQDVLDALIDFIRGGRNSSADVLVHAKIARVLGALEDPRIARLLSGLLNDPRFVGYYDEPLYPLRYAAGWALVAQFDLGAESRVGIDWDAVERAAAHEDPQLAAPALLLLGFRLEDAPEPGAPRVLRNYASEERRALALLAVSDFDRARDIARSYDLLPTDHPLFANSASGAAPVVRDEPGRWRAGEAAEEWLRTLNQERDVEGVLLKLATARTGLDLGVADFDATALRRKKRVPLMTLSQMFGME